MWGTPEPWEHFVNDDDMDDEVNTKKTKIRVRFLGSNVGVHFSGSN